METIDQIIAREEEQMSQQTSTSTSKPFWDIPSVSAFKLLLTAYKEVVSEHDRSFMADRQTLENIKAVAIWLTTPSDKRGIYLGGSCGNGKTTMMRAFEKVCNKIGKRVLRTSAPKMVAWHLDGHSVLDLPYQERVICIDDLGTEAAESMVYGNKVSVMADFFEEAYKARCFLFVTSNLGAQEIEDRYGERVRDRFREIFHSKKFTNQSFR
jgi:DNA replication protein DnaC